MDYVESLEIYGVEAKEIPCIVGNGMPTKNAPIGCLYLDENSGKIYKRVKKGENSLEWVEFKSGEMSLEPGEAGQILTTDENGDISWGNVVPCIVNNGTPIMHVGEAQIGSLYLDQLTGILYKKTSSDWEEIHESSCTKYYIKYNQEKQNYLLYKLSDGALMSVKGKDLYDKLYPINNGLVEIYLEADENSYVDGNEINFNSSYINIKFSGSLIHPFKTVASIALNSNVVSITNEVILEDLTPPPEENFEDQDKCFLWCKPGSISPQWMSFGLNSATEGQIPVSDGNGGIVWKTWQEIAAL